MNSNEKKKMIFFGLAYLIIPWILFLIEMLIEGKADDIDAFNINLWDALGWTFILKNLVMALAIGTVFVIQSHLKEQKSLSNLFPLILILGTVIYLAFDELATIKIVNSNVILLLFVAYITNVINSKKCMGE